MSQTGTRTHVQVFPATLAIDGHLVFLLFLMLYHRRHYVFFFFFSSRRRHTRLQGDWSSDVCSSDLRGMPASCGSGGGSVAFLVGWRGTMQVCKSPKPKKAANDQDSGQVIVHQ